MPRLTRQLPSYRQHRPSGQAVVTLNGRTVYLGPYNTPGSRQRYDDLIRQYLAQGRRLRGPGGSPPLTIAQLGRLYVEHAATYYVKHGRHTSEYDQVRRVVALLVRFHGHDDANDFGPRDLDRIKLSLAETGRARTSINRDLGRIQRCFKWAGSREYVDPTIYAALRTVDGLKRGRSLAAEPEPILPVDQEVLHATVQHLHPVLKAMVWVQAYAGMRPGELVIMRPRDVDRSDDVWTYCPSRHKTEHHGGSRVILLGPAAQKWLAPYLLRADDAFCFSPAEVVRDGWRDRREKRKTPLTPSQSRRSRRAKPRKQAGTRYTTASYGAAIRRACAAAFREPHGLTRRQVNGKPETRAQRRARLTESQRTKLDAWQKRHEWSPNQLRHYAATRIRRQHGLEAARAVLGHTDLPPEN